MITTILLFIAILAILVLTHEFGHYIVAKKSGMRVDEFGFGFPPKLFGVRKGETLYSFNLLPLGGFVKIHGEDGEDRKDKRSFASKPMWQRIGVVVAGVLMNFFVAYLFFVAVHVMGAPTAVEDDFEGNNVENISVQILDVLSEGPADEAGVQLGDAIRSVGVDGTAYTIETGEDLQTVIENNPNTTLIFTIDRGGDVLEKEVEAGVQEEDEEKGFVGIAFSRIGLESYPLHEALWRGAETTVATLYLIIGAFGELIGSVVTEGAVPEGVAGPVGIATLTGVMQGLGVVYVLQFIALISLNLGLINIIPFPALDGGRLVFLLVEAVKGSPVNPKMEGLVHAIGFAVLILLILAITYHDIINIL